MNQQSGLKAGPFEGQSEARTKAVFMGTRVLRVPFLVIFNTLFIILYKELHATPLQIALCVALKPMASIFSPYWSGMVHGRPERLVPNLVWANILKFLPFLFVPWMTNNWVIIAAFGFFMFLSRAVIPAWMEVLKRNIVNRTRERLFAWGSVLDYLAGGILPFLFGWVLDTTESWRWLFSCSAAIGMISTALFWCLPVTQLKIISYPEKSDDLSSMLLKPLRHSYQLLKRRKDFRQFQIGFMLGGSALMMIHTILPVYFVDVLHLSYTEILFAMALCKSIGFTLTSPIWVRAFHNSNIYRLCAWITALAGIFPLVLYGAIELHVCLFGAYIIYGVMQAGSELCWHMSGPAFSKRDDSTPYSTVNVFGVGVRGCLAPLLGTIIAMTMGPGAVIIISSLMCFFASERMWAFGKQVLRTS